MPTMSVKGKFVSKTASGLHPRISIIVAVFNGENTIENCLNSLWRQTYENFEVIVVNDGSTDGTSNILRELKDPRLRLIFSHQNQGCSAARNLGIDHARGEYLAVLDADDISLPRRLELQLKYLDDHLQCGIVGCYFKLESELGDARIAKRPLDDRSIRKNMCLMIPFIHSGVMMRTSTFAKTCGYNPTLTHGEDYRLFADILVLTEGANIPEVLVIKHETATGLTFRISILKHFMRGLLNRFYVARVIDPSPRGYCLAVIGAFMIPVVRLFGLNRESLRKISAPWLK